MALDKWIAGIFLVLSLIYGYASYTYPLLPFERNMAFLPNTMPMALSVLGVVLALIILFGRKPAGGQAGEGSGELDLGNWRQYRVGEALQLIGAMALYAVALRPAGFLIATMLFLFGTGWILGERRPFLMLLVAAIAAGSIWYLIQETLGIFLRPLPWFLG